MAHSKWFPLAGVSLVLLAASSLPAQEPALPQTFIEFCLAESGEEGGLLLTQGKPETRTREATVKVPVSETVLDANGQEKVVTKMVDVTKTQVYTVMVPVQTEVPAGVYKVYRMSGAKLSDAEIGSALRTPKKVIVVQPGQKLDIWYRDVIRPDTLVVVRTGEPALPDLPPVPPAAPSSRDTPLPPVPPLPQAPAPPAAPDPFDDL